MPTTKTKNDMVTNMNLLLIAISGSICLLQIGNGVVSVALAFRSPNIWLGSDKERRSIAKTFSHQPTSIILHQRQINYSNIPQTTKRRHILSNPSGSISETSPLFMADTSENIEPLITNDMELLTPETYADTTKADSQVEEVIGTKASAAFESTDFTNEPELSPELDGCSLDFDELIDNTAVSTKEDAFQRKLLEERLANNRSKNVKKSEGEAFQRSLLSARIANDTKVKLSSIGDLQQKDDNSLESKVLYASESDSGTEELQQQKDGVNLGSDVVETVAVEVAEAKQDELITDIVGEGNQMAAQLMKAAMEQEMRDAQARAAAEEKKRKLEEEEKRKYLNDAPAVQQVQQPVALSGINQWRKNDYVDEVRQAMYHNAMAKTKARLSSKNKSVRDTDREYESTISTVDEVVEPLTSTAAAAAAITTSSKQIEERDMKQDIVIEVFGKRVRQRRSYVVIALAVVACRRLALAFFGYSMRLI